jgi:hypothetical protein
MRIAVVTPYHKESEEVLARCMASVREQSVAADHILVADGHPQYWVEEYANVAHLVLRKSAADYGDTPRSLGFVLGVRRDYDIIQFLDADNILYGGHFDLVLNGFAETAADLLIARRDLLRPDGSIIDWKNEEDDNFRHVDTSCFVFSRSAFPLGLKWSHIPREFGCIDDRIFFAVVQQTPLRVGILPSRTVGYTCMWPGVYKAIGEEPPPGAHEILDVYAEAKAWWDALDETRRQLVQSHLGAVINIGG